MSYAPNNIEVKLTIHYYGLKATQYFSKTSPESELVFLDDLLALKLPLPKRGNTTLISFGRMQCIWPSVQRNGLLHKQIKQRVQPATDFRPSTQEQLAELSIANIMAKFKDLNSLHIDQVSFKRSIKDLEDPSQDERPLKKKKFEQEPMDVNASGSISTTKRTQNSINPKTTVDTASKNTPLAPKIMPDWWKSTHQHSHSVDSSSTSLHDTTSRRYSTNNERIASDTKRATNELLNNMSIPKGLPNREQTSQWEKVKQETSNQPKAPPTSVPAAIHSSMTLPIQPTPSNPSISTPLSQRPGSSTSSLPARPNSNPPPLSASSADSPVRRLSRFGPAPAPAPAQPTRYSPHTLAAFAKEYTKVERVSPVPFEKAPSPPPPSHVPAPKQPPASTTIPYDWLLDDATPPELAVSVDSTLLSRKAGAAAPPSTFKPFKLAPRDERKAADGKEVRGMRGWAEEKPAAREYPVKTIASVLGSRNQVAATDARDGKLKATTTATATATIRQGSGTGGVQDVEMREPQRTLVAAPPSTPSGSVQNGKQGSSGSASTSARGDESALVELRKRLAKMEKELAEERRRRQVAEDAIADIRRECRAPFVVPSLLDAFMELSRMTTIATTNPGGLVTPSSSNNSNNKHPPQNTTTTNPAVVLNASAPARRLANVDSTGRPLPPPRSADSYATQNVTRVNGQWSGSPNLPPPVFVKAGNAPVRVKAEPIDHDMSWRW